MALVAFIMRTPGEHKEICRVDMPFLPRVDEWVALNEDIAANVVHSVTHIVGDPDGVVAHVLLRP